MSGHHDSPEEIKKHLPLYYTIGGALFAGTIITVFVASFIHFSTLFMTVTVALLIACVKGSLVGAVFMHLKGEKAVIWGTLALTFIFFVVLMALPVLTTEEGAGERITPFVSMKDAHSAHGEGHDAGHEAKSGEATHAPEASDAHVPEAPAPAAAPAESVPAAEAPVPAAPAESVPATDAPAAEPAAAPAAEVPPTN